MVLIFLVFFLFWSLSFFPISAFSRENWAAILWNCAHINTLKLSLCHEQFATVFPSFQLLLMPLLRFFFIFTFRRYFIVHFCIWQLYANRHKHTQWKWKNGNNNNNFPTHKCWNAKNKRKVQQSRSEYSIKPKNAIKVETVNKVRVTTIAKYTLPLPPNRSRSNNTKGTKKIVCMMMVGYNNNNGNSNRSEGEKSD